MFNAEYPVIMSMNIPLFSLEASRAERLCAHISIVNAMARREMATKIKAESTRCKAKCLFAGFVMGEKTGFVEYKSQYSNLDLLNCVLF